MIKYVDDMLVIAGIFLISAAGFVLHLAAGLGILGIGSIAFGILIARGGGIVARKKRSKPDRNQK